MKCRWARALVRRQARAKRRRAFAQHNGLAADRHGHRRLRKNELRLPGADQLDIDLGQKLGIEQRAVLGAPRIVDRITQAEIVEPVGAAGMLAARDKKRIDDALAAHRGAAGALQFGVEEAEIEHGIMGDQLGVAEKSDQLVDLVGEQRLILEELAGSGRES